ncbi:MAG: hypothetical protein SFZ23_04520 [Planctomycetota bacterium]|nr:hypothetical protein [Planctomycetota bacterium]
MTSEPATPGNTDARTDMFVFILYTALIWWLAYKYRRQWQGVATVLGSAAFIVFVSVLHVQVSRWTRGEFYLPVVQFFIYMFGLLVLVGSVFFVCVPRRLGRHCRSCNYNVDGLAEEGKFLCPECGKRHAFAREADMTRCPRCRGDLTRELRKPGNVECHKCLALLVDGVVVVREQPDQPGPDRPAPIA